MDAFVQRLPRAGKSSGSQGSKKQTHERPAKRAKTREAPESKADSVKLDDFQSEDLKPSDISGDTAFEGSDAPANARPTDVENALPAAQDEEEAIHEYETMKASASSPLGSQDGKVPSPSPKWTKGRSSIYVDAFILALETVLEDESHLFDEIEKEIFNQWKQLDYEAQYLYDFAAPGHLTPFWSPIAHNVQICAALPPQDRFMAPVRSPGIPFRRLES